MTFGRLLLRSLWWFKRTNLGVLLGVAVASAVITGALIVGDSVRYTLSRTADLRLGSVQYAVAGGDRLFTNDLAKSLGPNATGVLAVRGVLATPDGQTRASEVDVYGVDRSALALTHLQFKPDPGAGIANDALLNQLGGIASEGQVLVLRVPEFSALPVDASLVNASKPSIAIRLRLGGALRDDQGARFSLRAEQRKPHNLFVDRAWLAEQLGIAGKVNTVLMRDEPDTPRPSLADMALTLKPLPGGGSELQTERVFIDASIEQDLSALPGQRLLTYMANTIERGDRQSPYAMVTAVDGLGTLELADDQIAINQWLADDLGAGVGDRLQLSYYVPDEGDRLTEDHAELTVARIVPMQGPYADRALTPDFPGLAEAESLSRWDAGPAIDRTRIRDKDEAYWDDYRATPKAFVSLKTGQRLWSNRFGTLTAIRFETPVDASSLTEQIDAAALGFVAIDLRGQADQAAAGTVDFGQLFLSLSGFIIIAAFVLTATLFAMSAEQRARQLGVLQAVGLTRRQAAILILTEGGLIAILGGLVGLLSGLGYAHAVLGALSGLWSGAVAGTPIELGLTSTSLIAGPAGAVIMSVLAMLLTVRGLLKRQARELLSGAVGKVSEPSRVSPTTYAIAGFVLLVLAGAMAAVAVNASGMKAGLWGFGAGSALMAALTLALMAELVKRGRRSRTRVTPSRMAMLGLKRRRGRTLAAVVTLSCGVFLVLAIAGFRLGLSEDPNDRTSGTGGYALIVETSQPVRYDLNTELGRDHYALSEDELPPASVVPIRVSNGDDASCLNLNQTATPRVLGVDPARLAEQGAFTFMAGIEPPNDWTLLSRKVVAMDRIPAIADANTAQWALKLAIGDTMTLTDERGQPFTIELVGTIENSILQGSLIIDEGAFKRLYPSTSGYRMLLVDAEDASSAEETRSVLQEVLVDEGVTITPTQDRLASYNTVQNTYLSVFQALGGLGVVLGALGLGVIAARNLLERRPELALLLAVGLSRRRVLAIVAIEHGLLLLTGLAMGLVSAWIATGHTGKNFAGAWDSAALTTLAVLAAGCLAVVLGLWPAWSNRLSEALRND